MSCLCLLLHRYARRGMGISAPEKMQWLSLALVLLAIEGVRRTGGGVVTIIIVIFAVYPLVAGSMPGVLRALVKHFGYIAIITFHRSINRYSNKSVCGFSNRVSIIWSCAAIYRRRAIFLI